MCLQWDGLLLRLSFTFQSLDFSRPFAFAGGDVFSRGIWASRTAITVPQARMGLPQLVLDASAALVNLERL